MFEMEALKQAIIEEGGLLSDEILDRFIESGKIITVKPKDYIIEPGKTKKSIWITASGITKLFCFNGKKEKVIGFAGMGTISLSPVGFLLNRPAVYGFQAITECEMIEIGYKEAVDLINDSHEFTKWILKVFMLQLSVLEMKAQILNEEDIITNYKKIVERQMKLDKEGFYYPNRPNLLNVISSKDLASYLGITQSYLSNIRKAIIEEERTKKRKK